jgi:hypothetical protein
MSYSLRRSLSEQQVPRFLSMEGRRLYFSAEPLKLVQQPLQCRHVLREHQRVH